MSNAVLAALITGAATLIVGALAAYFALRGQKETAQRSAAEAQRQADEAHRREAVAYLETIAETIKGMREQLAQKEIPRTLGHHFSGLLDSYEVFLQPYLGDKTQDELDKLRQRVQESAEFVDPVFLQGVSQSQNC